MKIKILHAILFIFISNILISQENQNNNRSFYKNSIFFDTFYYRSYIKISPTYYYHTMGFMINYYRTFSQKGLSTLKGEIGLGIFEESQGETGGFLPSLNMNFFLKNFIGKNKHFVIIGLGSNFIPWYRDVQFIGAIGYNYNFSKRISANIYFNQVIWYYSKQYNEGENKDIVYEQWIWNSDSNKFWISIGLGINF